ncbi:MAG TPA: iron-containing alcohol dehydrogenase [Pirellulales bacterium]|nr:iron-containing alcohol dehydrogenase [Pirellulales bacterium]
MIAYDFFAPAQIVFGWGRRSELADRLRPLGRRVWLVWGSRTLAGSAVGQTIVGGLADAGLAVTTLASVTREPTIDDVDSVVRNLRELAAAARKNDPTAGDVVLAIGGGSAIDMAKAAAALATNTAGETVRDYLEGVGQGLAITAPPLPVAAVPTTAGTGSEATKNSVISVADPACKKSLRSDLMVPKLVLVDPELTVSVPAAITAQTGMDAVTQLIESFISRRARPLPQSLARGILGPAMSALAVAVREPAHRGAREIMAQAALVSGMCLANAGLGLAHGVAAALGVHADAPHGLACAVMLPAALRANRVVAEGRLVELARAVGIDEPADAAAADAFVDRVEALCREVGIPRRLSELGVKHEQIPALVRDSRGNSMSGNPRDLDDAELAELLEQIW